MVVVAAEAGGVIAAHAAAGCLAQTDLGALAELAVEEPLPAQVVRVVGDQRREVVREQGREAGADQ